MEGIIMETSLAFTIIAGALTLLGLFKFLAPKKFNENAMGELHQEAINPAAAIRAALGGVVLTVALIAFMSRDLGQAEANTILCAIGTGLVTTIIFVLLNKVRGFATEIPVPPLVLLGTLSIIAFTSISDDTSTVSSELQPEIVSPDVYRVLFEDENIKVIEVEHEPGESDDFHGHHPMTWYAVQGGTLEMTAEDGSVNVVEIKTGQIGRPLQGQVHKAKNVGDTKFKAILFEEK
jgi:quercetin dioxygenase-like cupin family protein